MESQTSGANGSCSSLVSSTSDEQQQQQQHSSFRLQRNHSVGGGLTSSSKPSLARLVSVPNSDASTTATVGEYKYTVSVGNINLKITGDCFELVRVAKLVLDDYFSGQEFLGVADAAPTTPITPATESKLNPFATPVVPQSISAARQSSFVDSGIGLNLLNQSGEADDEVFIVESGE